ncbi:MAG: hypothetical protein BD935_00125 [Marine Group III euryarchaeote CG-Epi1]|uniref:Oxidoreductase n=1 Tax=Marine Group III euryarchaeote CG-Epi1 TaxID=1888995 RepID=A0A1J5TY48_9ARCH|nr:MAG: hypothetical protein BD935_00125 [Marine Group III euryarchaeote CG-Epi1]
MKNIRTGVIGTGSMGQNHARVYSEISNLVGVADLNEGQGKKVANRFGVKWHKNFEDLLLDVDAVSIAVPTSLHLQIAKKVLLSGVHVLVEKPLSNSIEEASEIVKLAAKTDLTLAVGHVERHNPVVNYAKKAIDGGKWGEIITLTSKRVSNFPERITDVGVLFDLCIHDIDISNYLSNSKVNSVYALGGKKRAPHEDHINLCLSYDSGLISICETNWLTPNKVRKLEITTSTHYIELDYQSQSIELFKSKYINVNKSNLYSSNLQLETIKVPINQEEPLKLELADFLQSTVSNKTPLVTGEEALEVVRISAHALESLMNKKVIKT